MVVLSSVNYKVGRRTLLDNISLTVKEGESLSLTGENGSGKTLLGKILARQLVPTSGTASHSSHPSYVSFERQEAVLEEERQRDDSRFFDGNGAENPGRSLEVWICEGNPERDRNELGPVLRNLGLWDIRERGLRYLSTGEFRKTMMARALWEESDFLVMDDPYDGLDRGATSYLKKEVRKLIESGTTVIVISGRQEDLPENSSHLVIMKKGRIHWYGTGTEGRKLSSDGRGAFKHKLSPYLPDEEFSSRDKDSLITCRNVVVAYGDKSILTDLNWDVRRGEKWLLSGPNGAGKSTLLSLINGDNPKAYGNDITLFGKRKGSGESVWDIKEKIGFISGGFQLNYRVRSSLEGVVLSGFFDSIGLYDKPNESQLRKAGEWLEFCGLEKMRHTSFEELSFGEKRMALIARSLIKSPPLLILDEPCQGLDDTHRDEVVSLCEDLGKIQDLTMIYVTHNQASTPGCLTRRLELVPCEKGGYTGKTN